MKLISLAALALAAGTASAQFTIFDGNSSADFNSNQGQVNWLVDGTDQVFTQEFWFRRNGVDSRELRVDSTNLNLGGTFVTDTNPFTDNRNDAFGTLFQDGNGLEFEVLFTLRGGTNGSGQADLAEQITIRNRGSSAVSLSFFQFVDFDLGGDFSDDMGQILSGNVVQQWDNDFTVSETVVTPAPTLFQMSNQLDIASLLGDNDIDDLNGSMMFAGDVGWAFQWNITLGANQSFLISKDKSITPAPGALALLGMMGLAGTRRRRA